MGIELNVEISDRVATTSGTLYFEPTATEGAIRYWLEKHLRQKLETEARESVVGYRGMGPNFVFDCDLYDMPYRTEASFVASWDLW